MSGERKEEEEESRHTTDIRRNGVETEVARWRRSNIM